jgi:hypothetical protein
MEKESTSSYLWDLITYRKGWVVVPNGSFHGYFDWIPIHLRIGPWSTTALLYATFLWCSTILITLYYHYYYFTPVTGDSFCLLNNNHTSSISSGCDMEEQQSLVVHRVVRRYWVEQYDVILQTSPILYRSWSWWYHTMGSIWMIYICYTILLHSPLSYRAWITYTVQSWSLLTIRHILCALSCFDRTSTLIILAEIIRFPCAVAHTITFVVWNFIIAPYVVFFALRHDLEKRRKFIQFCTNFRLFNLHGLNILFCIINVWLLNPTSSQLRRTLEMTDLYIAGLSAILYFTWYLCILDRLGVHLYPIFSPRQSGVMICATWTGAIILYLISFQFWSYIFLIDPSYK